MALRSFLSRRGAAWGLGLTALVALGCAAVTTAPRLGAGPTPAPASAAAAPTSAAAAVPAVATSAAAAASTPEESVAFDPDAAVPLLDDARLAAVKAAVTREAYVEAVKELDAVLAAEPRPSKDDEHAFRYQLGRLRALAGDPLGAARAYGESAAIGGPLEGYARYQAADHAQRAGEHAEALRHLDKVPADLPVASEVGLLRADALLGKGDLDAALPHYRAYLGKSGHPPRWVEVSLKVARALLQKPSEEHAEEAIGFARRVLYEAPSGAGNGEAKAIETDALGSLPFPRRKAFETPSQDDLLSQAKRQLDAGQSREALRTTDGLIADARAQAPGDLGCGAWMVRAEALARLKKKPEAEGGFGTAIERCAGTPRRVEALWHGGKASARNGQHGEAIRRYGLLEQEFPTHRLADDARLKSAHAARELGDEVRFTQMLTKMPDDYPQGDMTTDGLFELALARMTKRDWAGAVAPLERALGRAPRERVYYAAGRLPYYLGRARLETGALDQGKELLASVIRDYPLSFYMSLAYARLADKDRAAADRALDEALAREGATAPSPPPKSAAFGKTEFLRALALARQGESRLARIELDRLGVGARTAPPEVLWASALLFSRAGSPKEAHQILRTATNTIPTGRAELTDWTDHYPAGNWRSAWEIAFPRPYAPVVAAEATRSGIPESLAYAIMREESAFDPRVVSSAAAVGLMQLIVPTAQRMAKPLKLKGDAESLKRPEINIALGCRYLSILRAKFQDNPLLAIPGYNAGGGKPKDWVDERPNEDFDLWVEQIPYEETRLYTKRVMTSMSAYDFLYGKGKSGETLAAPLWASPAARGKMAATP
ncbi:transglycosylase SLT domain-containing protein [Polyangium sorediatum]|uniref:Transglycosylase SLT domain-containing protein n=1 Tax=Polyangium sorediatum TaxID=889274 RepID=A0ABT6NVD9_9BACT|nr:transglycosylase SLT domain-containing protein [Polyangium sorediatum]MDI1432310.1 transglycosylase SLT domain-containing protein [Polyangium sorediatum]